MIVPVEAKKFTPDYNISYLILSTFTFFFFYALQNNASHTHNNNTSTKPNTLKHITLNANGITNKTDEINKLITKTNPDILLIQETKIPEENEYLFESAFPNYIPFWNFLTKKQMKDRYLAKKLNKLSTIMELYSDEQIQKKAAKLNPNNYKHSAGVLTLVHKDLAPFLIPVKGETGRILTLHTIKNINNNKNKSTICKNVAITNVYAPTGSSSATNDFFEHTLKEHLNIINKITKNIIIRRDMNATINKDLDRWSNYSNTNEKLFKKFEEFCTQFTDTWRHTHPSKIAFTWSAKSDKDPNIITTTMARLDYFLASKHYAEKETLGMDILHKCWVNSDHLPVCLITNDFRLPIAKKTLLTGSPYEITKINTHNVNKNTKLKFTTESTTLTPLSTNLNTLHTSFSKDLLNDLCNKWNEIAYKTCKNAFGITKIIMNGPPKNHMLNNKELGLLKGQRAKLNTAFNALVNAKRTNRYTGNKLINAINKINKQWHTTYTASHLNADPILNKLSTERKETTNEMDE